MTVQDILDLLTDGGEIEIFSLDKGETVYKGDADEVPYNLAFSEVQSIDTFYKGDDHLTINID